MQASTIKPGLLVSFKTTVFGGVRYARIDLEPDHAVGDGRRARWETQREIEDATEYEQAIKVRSACRSLIVSVCCPSSFGMLCPESREAELSEAITQARALAATFNATSARSKVEVFAITGRIARDDEEAARAIRSEMLSLMQQMQEGVQSLNVDAIRDAANKARALGSMLSDEVSGKVSQAIKEARTAAREIVKRVQGAGESAAVVLANLNVEGIESARFAFLDLEESQEISEQTEIAPRVVEFDTVEAVPVYAAPQPQSYLEF